jgi:8-amino-7-oxononanoate synthase
MNYAQSLIYSTTLASMNYIAVSCAMDLLEDGTAEDVRLHDGPVSYHTNTLSGSV